jgi:hypothetical protein
MRGAVNPVTTMKVRDASLNTKTDVIRPFIKCRLEADPVLNPLIGNDQHYERLQSRDV